MHKIILLASSHETNSIHNHIRDSIFNGLRSAQVQLVLIYYALLSIYST